MERCGRGVARTASGSYARGLPWALTGADAANQRRAFFRTEDTESYAPVLAFCAYEETFLVPHPDRSTDLALRRDAEECTTRLRSRRHGTRARQAEPAHGVSSRAAALAHEVD